MAELLSGSQTPELDLSDLCSVDRDILYFPVRHHSPLCAKLIQETIKKIRPAHVLIEGPADFNDKMDELMLRHKLPIAIYSYLVNEERAGAYYPFCEYSPEWVGLRTAGKLKIPVSFIDLPWSDLASVDRRPQRYADAEYLKSHYIDGLCNKHGVDDFDDLWDRLFEVHTDLSLEEYLARAHNFCAHMRLLDPIEKSNHYREHYMADFISEVQQRSPGKVLVITGGYHSLGIYEILENKKRVALPDLQPFEGEKGISLTPYSYERLDNLTGYNAGMPNPGFYHQAWKKKKSDPYEELMTDIINYLRLAGQQISAADLIAAKTTSNALAMIRGNKQIWRRDLIDGITGALIKDDISEMGLHPYIEAVNTVLRGDKKGKLSKDAVLPPLFVDIEKLLAEVNLTPSNSAKQINLKLKNSTDLAISRLLHRLKSLDISGFQFTGGTDFSSPSPDLLTPWENWTITWTIGYQSSAIEAAMYGSNLEEAVVNKLDMEAAQLGLSSSDAIKILLRSAMCGLSGKISNLLHEISQLIAADHHFLDICQSLKQLFYLYQYDEVLGTSGTDDYKKLLFECRDRTLWLLDDSAVKEQSQEIVKGMKLLIDCQEKCRHFLDETVLVEVLKRICQDDDRPNDIRGAAIGALWSLGYSDKDEILKLMMFYANPQSAGDFLAGLFCLAREALQRHKELLNAVHKLICEFGNDEFVQGLPSLRLAFTFFTPREKDNIAKTLFRQNEQLNSIDLNSEVSPEVLDQVLLFNNKLEETIKKFNIRQSCLGEQQ